MKPSKLDTEEARVLDDFEQSKLKRIPGFRREKAALEDAAAETLRKDKRINIRISSRDLEQIQKRAAREGVPYQTFIAATLHKVVNGRLKESG